jgi:hypothetical protein
VRLAAGRPNVVKASPLPSRIIGTSSPKEREKEKKFIKKNKGKGKGAARLLFW